MIDPQASKTNATELAERMAQIVSLVEGLTRGERIRVLSAVETLLDKDDE